MRSNSYVRAVLSAATILAMCLVISGCGDDQPTGSETGPGAPADAKGSAAGGAAVEAGKQRNPQDVENEKKAYGAEPPPVQIALSEESGWKVDKSTVAVINSDKELDSYKKKLQSKNSGTEAIAPIDFKTRQLVVVQMPKVPGGTNMQILQVGQDGNKILVRAIVVNKGKGCKSTGTNNPVHVVETRKMTGTPKLSFDEPMNNDACS
ncbi:MAG: hypothetical protein JHD02_09100 [Thermoleophilaceae bacterium]|nr:hypothetical protein [Thermoleophilaceae bacterium]